ncbi:MAG: helix-turn-helix transcriptional regulator [Dehalococcoidia bacterium]|nr:helix-turn-helix transcriptional regulator [Dehalococcoidia bacterium]
MAIKNPADRNSKDTQQLKKIGDNIRAARKRAGYSQETFADIAGFSRSYYTEIETGKRNVSILNIVKILENLNAEPNEIIGTVKPKK